MKPRYKYDRYLIQIPDDFGSTEDVIDQAIAEASERTRVYAVPCEWRASLAPSENTPGNVAVRVVRKRIKPKSTHREVLTDAERKANQQAEEEARLTELAYDRYANGGV
jgi:hypothetical protein